MTVALSNLADKLPINLDLLRLTILIWLWLSIIYQFLVDLVSAKPDETDEPKVWVKIMSKDLVDGEIVKKYFDGWWLTEHTVTEADRDRDWESDRILLAETNIKEISSLSWLWFYQEVLDKLK